MNLLVISYGCDKNLVDTEKMMGILRGRGYAFTDDEAQADVIVINTCCFINDAKEESINAILEMAEQKEHGRARALVVAGCLAERYREEIRKEIPEVDAIVGTNSWEDIGEAIDAALSGKIYQSFRSLDSQGAAKQPAQDGAGQFAQKSTQERVGQMAQDLIQEPTGQMARDLIQEPTGQMARDLIQEPTGQMAQESTQTAAQMTQQSLREAGSSQDSEAGKPLAAKPTPGRVMATGGCYEYLKIAEGCDKHCTYCIIPTIRGRYRSTPMETLLEEARELARMGVRELILVAQETTCYGVDLYGEKRLPALLRELCNIEGLEWIRLLYCYPEEITEELVAVIREEPKICHYLDLPVQHASDAILKRMGRRANRAQLEGIITMLRREIPDICLRTTLITGFPGEREEQHQELLDFVDEMEFDRLGVFCYSQEEGTPAAAMEGQMDEERKERRREELMALQQEIAFERASQMVGRTFTALVEGKVVDEEVFVGRTYRDAPGVDGYIFIHAGRELHTGELVSVRVTKAAEYDLIGELTE